MSDASAQPAPIGAVLAGGAGERLGGQKAAVELAGRPLISYPIEALRRADVLSIVVAKPGSRLPALTLPVVVEPAQPLHPLLGVVAALKHAGGRPSLVVPCDAPFVTPSLLGVLASAVTTTAVRGGGRAHPLIALYAADTLPVIEEAVAKGASATETLGSLGPEWIDASEDETFNVNTPDDLALAEEMLRRARS